MNDHKSTQYLIGQIERKDRRFRVAQSLFLLFISLSIAATSAFLYNSILQSQKRDEAAIAKQTAFIRCIARAYTSATDGQKVTINDLDKCKITTEERSTAQPTMTAEPAHVSSTPLTVTNPAPVGFTQPPASNSSPAPAQQPSSPAPPAQSPKPVQVLGIPVCIPLTQVCARQ